MSPGKEITYVVRIYAMSEAMTWRKQKDQTAIDKKTFWKVLPQKYKIRELQMIFYSLGFQKNGKIVCRHEDS